MNLKNKIILFAIILLLFSVVNNANAEILTLSEGLRLVKEKNRLVKITRHDEAISEADTYIERARLLPQINASFSQTALAYLPEAIFGHQIVPVSEKGFLSYSLSVQQLLYDFQGSVSRYRASKKILETKKYDTRRIINLVCLDFAIMYFDLLESEKMILVAEKEVERLESHLKDAQHLYDEGVITKNDLFQAEVRLSDAKQKLVAIKNRRAINASRLKNAIAQPLLTDIQVIDIKNTNSNFIDMDLTEAWKLAEQLRPEIQIVDTTLDALEDEEIAKRSEYFPHFFLKASYDYTENRFYVHEGNLSLVAGVNLNIFNGWSTKAGITKIKQKRLKLLEQKDKLVDEIKIEVEKYFLDLKSAKEKIKVTKGAIAQAEENLRINKLRYTEGVGTATEVLDAVTLLTIAETNYYKSLYDFRRAEAGFLYAIGKDLSDAYQES